MKRFLGKRPALFKSGQWHFHQDNTPVSHNSILVTDYLTKMGIKTVPTFPIVQTLLPVTFGYSLSSLWDNWGDERGCDEGHWQEDFDGAFQKLLERYKCIAAGGDCFKGD